MKQFDRRSFIKQTALAAASLAAFPAIAAESSSSPNGDVRCAVVGFNSRGKNHIDELLEIQGTRLVALCDVDQSVLDREVTRVKGKGTELKGYTDIRKLLEDKDIDVVTFATPNHWHALGAIWAIQAGKDVYLEKPVSHNVWEGRQIVNAARKHGRIVQTGTQSRSSAGIAQGIQYIREGNLGKMLRVRGICYKRRPSIGKVDGPQPIPPSIDYDLWCGPAPKEPLMRKKLHYDWHWVWPTGNGDLGNQGIHEMDVARWISGEQELSPRILSVGGRLGYDDDGTTPNTLVVLHDYQKVPLFFEVRGLPSGDGKNDMDNMPILMGNVAWPKGFTGRSIGILAECEGGTMAVGDYGSSVILDDKGAEVKRFKGTSSHMANFIAAVRSRKSSDLKADILEGHLSSALCHTANISYRLGTKQSPEAIRDAAKSNKELGEALGRMEQHLGANSVDLTKTPATLGAVLNMDPSAERFNGNPKANELLTREYRKPYVVPEKV